ncbi:unnamed protein product [Ambrosiozyma monospora]|uniref:Unnamed protein product n=1 Tax=Ambrosiozyma monospora TaxID=43982 RepID=A0ACB5SW58_AMBMO|nr:unnamed protein product [Ambrosiozyma monospora]
MVLINGVKYACERCIRGHRVTTCTHTDQPLLMIKPKGRPSTQCAHCQEQRKLKNAHTACTCRKKGDPKLKDHEVGCACRATGECTCTSKTKKTYKKREPTDKKKRRNTTSPNSKKNNKSTTAKDKDKDNKDSKDINKNISPSPDGGCCSNGNSNGNGAVAIKNEDYSPISNNNNNIIINNSLATNTTNNHTTAVSSMKFGDKDTINDTLHSWDMASPPIGMGPSESINSVLSDSSMQAQARLGNAFGNNFNTNNSINQNNGNDFHYFTGKRQVGMDPLQNFRSTLQPSTSNSNSNSNNNTTNTSNQKRIGEISIPMDEYVAPLNTMNTNFTNFMSTLSDADDISPKPINDIFEGFGSNSPDSSSRKSIPPGSGFGPQTVSSSTNISDLYSDVPFPLSSGTGLLDIFEDDNINNNNGMGNGISLNTTVTNNSSSSGNGNGKMYSNGIKNYSSTSVSSPQENHTPDSLFPLFPLIGPNHTQQQQPQPQQNSQQQQPFQQRQFAQSQQQSRFPIHQQQQQQQPISVQNTGNSTMSTHKLSYSNLNSHNMRSAASTSHIMPSCSSGNNNHPTYQQMKRNMTGSSTHSLHSIHSINSISAHPSLVHSYQTPHHLHSHHHHGHTHQSHYSPYPQLSQSQSQQVSSSQAGSVKPRRSSSILSLGSSCSGASSVVLSPTSSHASLISSEDPQPLYAESGIGRSSRLHHTNTGETSATGGTSGDELGNALTSAKTNTTLMEDIYQTRTYTGMDTDQFGDEGDIDLDLQTQQSQQQYAGGNGLSLNDELLASPPSNSTPSSMATQQTQQTQTQQSRSQSQSQQQYAPGPPLGISQSQSSVLSPTGALNGSNAGNVVGGGLNVDLQDPSSHNSSPFDFNSLMGGGGANGSNVSSSVASPVNANGVNNGNGGNGFAGGFVGGAGGAGCQWTK